jgi:hypothetical protein
MVRATAIVTEPWLCAAVKDVVHSSADDPRHARAIYTDGGSAEKPLVVLGTKGSSKAFN